MVGAVIGVGVVVGVAIKEALDAYALRGSSSDEVESAPQTKPASQEPSASESPSRSQQGRIGSLQGRPSQWSATSPIVRRWVLADGPIEADSCGR